VNHKIDKYKASRPATRDHWRNHTSRFGTVINDGVEDFIGFLVNDQVEEVPYINGYLESIGEEPIQNVSDLDERTVYNYAQGRDWTNRINRSARLYKNKIPSAITSGDGINNNMSKNKSKTLKKLKKFRKNIKKTVARKIVTGYKQAHRRGPRMAPSKAQKFAMNRLQSRGMNFRGGKSARTYTVPLVKGRSYSGYSSAMTSRRPNCINFKSRLFCGTLQFNVGTDRIGSTGVNVPLWKANGTDDNHGQFFFAPGNVFYMPIAGNFEVMARMFSAYIINNVSFTFESRIMPGNTTQTRTNYAFFKDVNYGMTQFGSANYDAKRNMLKSDLMNLPTSKSFPTWVASMTIAPPASWYRGKKKKLMGLDIDSALTFTEAHAGTNNDTVAFGMWLYIDHGSVVSNPNDAADVFMNIDIDFCDMVMQQNFDSSGSNSYMQSCIKRMPLHGLDRVQEIITARKSHAEFKELEDKTNQDIAKQWDELEQPVDLKRQDVVFDRLKLTDFEKEYITRIRKLKELKTPLRDIEDGLTDDDYAVVTETFRNKPMSVKSDYGDVKPLSDNKVKSSSNK